MSHPGKRVAAVRCGFEETGGLSRLRHCWAVRRGPPKGHENLQQKEHVLSRITVVLSQTVHLFSEASLLGFPSTLQVGSLTHHCYHRVPVAVVPSAARLLPWRAALPTLHLLLLTAGTELHGWALLNPAPAEHLPRGPLLPENMLPSATHESSSPGSALPSPLLLHSVRHSPNSASTQAGPSCLESPFSFVCIENCDSAFQGQFKSQAHGQVLAAPATPWKK